ncbi:ATP-binding protein [Halanaeroarchaeum sulfurireducens]|uniref:Putative ATPase (AAA+ superfamily) n=1 Tax=Halanaeroarchaeum sulfurireducens TaxID=1604004 RepID=A0A0F7P9E7_9EURY|nr:ATP-binding protein [Halanaeroarchaeum sulfurireducens]AKH97407.1 putative ATPase (AAA+ superfamily) [Halanaeroarchaeum sulfurireducens]ALG81809.1 putative ATPase (AAA+ superfamily) [Halanaeroarchaeum sulfurireducens]
MAHFVDRDAELDHLTDCYDSERAEFVVIYGRRRLGKSELVRRSIADRDDAVYYQAVESTAQNQLEQFVDTAATQFPALQNVRRDWEALLEALGERDAIVVIDEFPFLIQDDDSLPSRLQRVWDLTLQETAMTLVLVGSSISVMEEKVLSGNAPLYGRRTATIDLKPLSVSDARQFFPGYDPETSITAWSIYGGTPYYLQTIDPDEPLGANVQAAILSERGLLYSEPEFLLRTELRQPNTYFSILRALARGRRTPNEIAGMAGVESGSLSTYLQKLRRLRLVERHIPVTESSTTSKRGRYRIAAPLVRFWFRFVYGNQDQLRLLGDDAYDELVAPELADYVSPLFERLCQRALPDLVDRQFRDVGQWWFREHELDVLGLADEGLVAGECKFTSQPVSEGVLADLERTASEVRWSAEPADGDTLYVLFSRSGYTDDLERAGEARDDVQLFDLADLFETGF